VASWFVWTGEELVLPTFISAPHVSHTTYRVRALRTSPDVAAEYAEAAHRFLGSEQAAGYLAQIGQPGTRMARIAVRPTWVALMDFETRMPSALGGVQ
jgi:hypothetical protein